MTAPRITSALCVQCGACCSQFVDGELIACRHLDSSDGYKCRIYNERPKVCRDYSCVRNGSISEALKIRVLEAERSLNSSEKIENIGVQLLQYSCKTVLYQSPGSNAHHTDGITDMNNALTTFTAALEVADKAQQANSKARWAWVKADRATRGAMPQLVNGEDTVTMGRASCKMTPAPQSGRTNASRRNWKLDGKRATESAVLAYVASL